VTREHWTLQRSSVDEVLAEGERLLGETPRSTSLFAKADFYDWLEVHAEALLRVARAAQALRAHEGPATRTRMYRADRELHRALDAALDALVPAEKRSTP